MIIRNDIMSKTYYYVFYLVSLLVIGYSLNAHTFSDETSYTCDEYNNMEDWATESYTAPSYNSNPPYNPNVADDNQFMGYSQPRMHYTISPFPQADQDTCNHNTSHDYESRSLCVQQQEGHCPVNAEQPDAFYAGHESSTGLSLCKYLGVGLVSGCIGYYVYKYMFRTKSISRPRIKHYTSV
jgi:hypothetical protein